MWPITNENISIGGLKKPVLPEIVRVCLKVTWLNIFIDYLVFQNVTYYLRYIFEISFSK